MGLYLFGIAMALFSSLVMKYFINAREILILFFHCLNIKTNFKKYCTLRKKKNWGLLFWSRKDNCNDLFSDMGHGKFRAW